MNTPTASLPPLIRALLDPGAFPYPAGEVVLLQTHVSYILLAGDYAYKVKKPLDLGFLDFSTLERRAHFCRREVDLNRRLCPDLYLGVLPISLANGQARVGGDGAPCEWAVWMQRLPAERMLPVLLAADQVTPDDLARVARRLAAFHAAAATGTAIDAYATPDLIRRNTDENFEQLRPFVGATIPSHHYAHLRAYTDAFLARRALMFAARIATGRIRDGHGDIHAGSVCVLDDDAVIFDCIEFSDRFRYGDVASEVAFLAMDLDHYGRADLAWHFVNAYQQASGDQGLEAVLDFYKCYRAVVRGKVASLRVQQPDATLAEQASMTAAAREYFDLAVTYSGGAARPALLITTGLVGTGKTTLARALAGRLGLVHLSADATRKRLAGLAPTEHRYEAFGAGIYSEEFSRRTYTELLVEAYTWLDRGCGVIVDASFKRAAERERARVLAGAVDAPFLAVECMCPDEIVRDRLAARLGRPGEVSDGRPELLAWQRADFDPCDELDSAEHLVVDTTTPPETCADAVRDRLATLAGARLREEVGEYAWSDALPDTALAQSPCCAVASHVPLAPPTVTVRS